MSFTGISFCVLGFACLECVWRVLDSLVKSFFTFKLVFKSDVQIWFQNEILADCAHPVTGSLGCAEGGSSLARCLKGI